MLSMGITLSPKDFVNVLKRPNAVMVGFVFCYIMMPALAYALGIGAGLSPALLAGLVLVGCINGGQASNLCTFIANGNVRILGCCCCLVGLGCLVVGVILRLEKHVVFIRMRLAACVARPATIFLSTCRF